MASGPPVAPPAKTTGSITVSSLVINLLQRTDNLVPGNVPVARWTAIIFSDMEKAELVSGLYYRVTEAVLLDVHVVGIEEYFEIGTAHLVNIPQGVLAGIDEEMFEAVQDFKTEDDSMIFSSHHPFPHAVHAVFPATFFLSPRERVSKHSGNRAREFRALLHFRNQPCKTLNVGSALFPRVSGFGTDVRVWAESSGVIEHDAFSLCGIEELLLLVFGEEEGDILLDR